MYGLPKLHKPNCPLRPITSFIGSPTYNLSKNISKSLQKTVGLNKYYIKDSGNFKHKINNLNIPKNFTIISLDIVSMYTNITWGNKNTNEIIETKELKKIINLPYINNFQEQFYRIFKNSNLQIIFTNDNTVQQKMLMLTKKYNYSPKN